MEQLNEVTRILSILKKNPNRTYSETSLQKRLTNLNKIKADFKTNLENSNTKHTSHTFIKFSGTVKEIKNWLLSHRKNILEESSSDTEEETEAVANTKEETEAVANTKEETEAVANTKEETEADIMTSNLNLDTALKAIPIFNGNHKELDSFLAIGEIIYNSTNDPGKTQLIQIILNIKLSEKVKNAIGNQQKPETIADLSRILKQIYKNPLTLPQVLSKLSTIFQGKQSITNFKDKIIITINELTNLQISHLGDNPTQEQKDTIIKINETQALHIFKNGLEEKFKSTVFAAQPKTFNEAVNIATEIENTNSHSVMYMNSNSNFNRNHYNPNRQYNNNRYNNNNNNYNRSNNNNYNRNNNNNYNRNNNFNRNNFNRNNNNSNRNNNNDFNRNRNSSRNYNNNNNRTNNNFNRNTNSFENRNNNNYSQNDNNRTRIRMVNQDNDETNHRQQQEHYEQQGN